MAFTVYEYSNVVQGQPVEPPKTRSATQAFGAAVPVSKGTAYVVVVPDADMFLRISGDGSAATSADHHLSAKTSYGFPVGAFVAGVSLYGITG